jgi:hypothetical protein
MQSYSVSGQEDLCTAGPYFRLPYMRSCDIMLELEKGGQSESHEGCTQTSTQPY